mmetsp:Transcript_23672/g.36985  ORF Transcript_23672/g.36985 Transcript_23672/m.36985 type:complete len:156 (+) Transcript_23672:388-855(+)
MEKAMLRKFLADIQSHIKPLEDLGEDHLKIEQHFIDGFMEKMIVVSTGPDHDVVKKRGINWRNSLKDKPDFTHIQVTWDLISGWFEITLTARSKRSSSTKPLPVQTPAGVALQAQCQLGQQTFQQYPRGANSGFYKRQRFSSGSDHQYNQTTFGR